MLIALWISRPMLRQVIALREHSPHLDIELGIRIQRISSALGPNPDDRIWYPYTALGHMS